jgi:hypothetical protein
MVIRTLAVAGAALLLGCSARSVADPVIVCPGGSAAAEPSAPAVPGAGRLEIVRLGAPAPAEEARAETRDERFSLDLGGDTRLRVLAEGVPLGVLVPALGEVLGVPVVVAGELVEVRVSAAFSDVGLFDLFEALIVDYDVYPHWRDDTLYVTTPEQALQARRRPRPVDTRVVRVPPELPATQAAQLYCRQLRSPAGSAVLVGRRVVVRDRQDVIELYQQALHTLLEPGDVRPRKWAELDFRGERAAASGEEDWSVPPLEDVKVRRRAR